MTISLDKQLYSKLIILKVAYQFLDKVYIHLSQTESDWIIEWTPKDNQESIDSRSFENEAIAQQLRQQLIDRASDVRKIILARAYASTVVEDDESDLQQSTLPYYTDNVEGDTDVLKDWFDKQ